MRWQVVVLFAIVIVSALAYILAPQDALLAEPAIQLQPPNSKHILGTDMLGRDVLSRLLFGGQRTLLVAAFATCLAVTFGMGLGVFLGTPNQWGRALFSSLTNTLLAFPNLLLALVILTVLGVGLVPLIMATGFAQIAPVARIVHSAVLRVSAETFVESGYAIGATRWHIARFYVFPNIQATLLTYAAITFSYCLLNSAALSYLGLGGEPGVPDWGVMLAEGRVAFREAPWIAIAPGLAITITVWAINSLIDNMLSTPSQHF